MLNTLSANEHITIAKTPVLPKAQDYYALRAEGIDLIQRLGSKLWTDYNIHDPGITLMEVLSYAITDLGYRASFPVADLLAKPGVVFNPDDQAFFTARQILGTAPWTVNDYRKLLIDDEGIKNAWMVRRTGPYPVPIYVDCKHDALTYEQPEPPEDPLQHKVTPKGLYDVFLELDEDEQYGDLNTGKMKFTCTVTINGETETLFGYASGTTIDQYTDMEDVNGLIRLGTMVRLQANTIAAIKDGPNINNEKLGMALRSTVYISGIGTFLDPDTNEEFNINIESVPIRFVLMPDRVRQNMTMSILRNLFQDIFPSVIFTPYVKRLDKSRQLVKDARALLSANRNITEDFGDIRLVPVEEIGICADLEVTIETDIEQVLAEVYHLIRDYMNPVIRFNALDEMLNRKPVDEIYDGPSLTHGFIDDEDLKKSNLNRTLYSSDIINLIMDIPGVVAVRNFVLVRFDELGNRNGTDSWQLTVAPNHLPRLFMEESKVLVFKNGLPFVPDTFELMDTMNVVHGQSGMPKLKEHDPDLPIPQGTPYDLQAYFPVQNSLPLTYGTGPEGLPSTANALRQAQALQLKGYLLFFEQILINYLGQLAQLKQLYSLDNSIKKTYFPALLDEDLIKDANLLYTSLDEDTLYAITESENEFFGRRNRFLDHLLARFSENFSEYALLLYSAQTSKKVKAETLIHTKTSFLKQYPYQSAHKAQAFDYTNLQDLDVRKDLSGIHQRIALLLGLNPSANFFRYNIQKDERYYFSALTLHDTDGSLLMQYEGDFRFEDRNDTIREINLQMALLLRDIGKESSYDAVEDSGVFTLQFSNSLWKIPQVFASESEAEEAYDRLQVFVQEQLNDERFTIVEHLMLRPLAIGDSLLEVCVTPDCHFCGNEDPYSYRVTFVFNGESPRAQTNFEFRRFAEKTIRAELPAHVLAKICWVKKVQYDEFETAYHDWLINTDPTARQTLHATVVRRFTRLRSIYPPPTLHDCIEGNDSSRVFLNRTQL